MKVALINPESPFLIDSGVMGPLGLWYVGAALKRAGFGVDYFDLGLGDPMPNGYDAYGVTGTSAQVRQIEKIAYYLNRRDGLKIIGGPHATLEPQKMLELGFDTVVCGEGDGVIAEIVGNGRVGIVRAKKMRNIDNLFPDRLQQGRYHYEIAGLRAVTMVTSRGCPYNCSFCSKDIWGRCYIARGARSVDEEIGQVSRRYKAIMFYDDTFVIGRERLTKICSSLRHYGITWRAFCRSDEADYEMLLLMAESGCREIGIGIESGSPRILKNINKRETVEDHLRCIKIAHEVGLRVKGFVIVGLPGENWQTVFETDRFLGEAKLDDVDISILSVYAGSDIYKHPEKYDITFSEPTFFKGKPGEYECTVETSGMSKGEIVYARKMLHKKHKRSAPR